MHSTLFSRNFTWELIVVNCFFVVWTKSCWDTNYFVIIPFLLVGDAGLVDISEEDQKRLLAEYEEEMKKNDEDSGRNSRRSSGKSCKS